MKMGYLHIVAGMTATLVGFAVSSYPQARGPGRQAPAVTAVDTGLTFDLLVLASAHPEPHGTFGDSVAGVGDVNQDGVPDVVVGAWFEAGMAGRAYVFDGKNGSLLFELMSPNPRPEGLFGMSVSAAGDINQDGFADVLVGAAGDGVFGAWGGRAYIFGGPSGQLLFELVSPSRQAGAFGLSVSAAGDVDQDGVPDVIVGDPLDFGPYADSGKAYVFSGRDVRLLHELASPNAEMLGNFGTVSGAGDVDQDGFADVIVGAPREDLGRIDEGGHAYVFSGQTGAMLFELSSPTPADFGHFGGGLADAGDVNGDGHSDFIIGEAGRAYVFGGQDGAVLFQPKPPAGATSGLGAVSGAGDADADHFADIIATGGKTAFIFSGWDGSLLGTLVDPKASGELCLGFGAVAAAGDINRDGFADLIVGAAADGPPIRPTTPGGPLLAAGRAYIFLSRSGQP
jgi:hypothetical protein